jgi:hypothetical protein
VKIYNRLWLRPHSSSGRTSRNGQNSCLLTRVWIADSDGLILVCIVLDDAFCQDIEGSSHENVIGWAANDMDLEIQGNVSDSTRNVASKS